MRATNLRHLAVVAGAVALIACGARDKKEANAPAQSELGDQPARSDLGDQPGRSELGDQPGRNELGDAPKRNDSAAAAKSADAPAPRRAHSPLPAPKIVPAAVLESLRTKGERLIRPPRSVEAKLRRSDTDRIVVLVKMCVSKQGVPIRLETIRPSRFPRYDHRIFDAMRKWRFRPLEVDGKPVPVCTMVTFVYQK